MACIIIISTNRVGNKSIKLHNIRYWALRNWFKVSILITFLVWAVAVCSRLIISGTVYGLNYELFQPDGGNYLKLTQDLIDFKFQSSSIYSWSRPLYPVLSIPFYMLFGIYGMLVIPSLSLLAIGLIFLFFSDNKKNKAVLLVCFLIFTSSTTVLRWTVADLTDSLHLALFTLCCMGIHRKWKFKSLLLLVLLGSLARPMGPVWTALFIPFIFIENGKRKLDYILLSFVPIILFVTNTIIMIIYGGFAPNSKSITEQVTNFPIKFFQLIFVEFGQLAALDRVLFYFIILTFSLAAYSSKDVWSIVHLQVGIASFIISAWIGVYGVNFRYQLPLVITGSMVILEQLQDKFLGKPKFNVDFNH